MQCWDLLEANEQKLRIQHFTGRVGAGHVNIPLQSVPTVLTMIVDDLKVINLKKGDCTKTNDYTFSF